MIGNKNIIMASIVQKDLVKTSDIYCCNRLKTGFGQTIKRLIMSVALNVTNGNNFLLMLRRLQDHGMLLTQLLSVARINTCNL